MQIQAQWNAARKMYEVHEDDEYGGNWWASADGNEWVYDYTDEARQIARDLSGDSHPPANGTPVMGRDFDAATISLVGGPRNGEEVS